MMRSIFYRSTNNHSKLNMRILVIDIETNGLPISYVSAKKQNGFTNLRLLNELRFEECRAIEVAMIIVDFENDVATVKYEWTSLVSQNVPISNSDIHGITEQDVKNDGVHMDVVLEELSNQLDLVDTIVAHNADFDLQVLASECKRHGWLSLLERIDDKSVVCTMLLGYKTLKLPRWPKLVNLYERLSLQKATRAHRALDDCRMCLTCYNKLSPT